ncbi:MAG TPA: hypothetical protein VJX29_02205 [Candidatus Acidoferrales bacterium]|nr:hypothetical protein [Candidatus Acidoferrales bacterium]
MCNASFPCRTRRAALLVAMLGVALVAAGCAVPLGPGYTVERQRFEVAFVSAPRPHLDVRATWRVKNTGDRALSAVEVKLPDAETQGRSGTRLDSGGSELTPAQTEAGNTVSIAFPSPLAVKAKQEIGVSYELNGIPRDGAAVVVKESGFVLPPGEWAPSLVPPKGSFARGGEPPKQWEMTVRVPSGFRVHSSGRERGQKREAGNVVIHWEEQQEDFSPFVAGGAYQEERFAAADGGVIIWTLQAMPPGLAQRAAEVVAQTAGFYDEEFRPRDSDEQTIWIIECPSGGVCWPVPEAVVPGREVFVPKFWSAGESGIDRHLARTWLDFRVHPDWDAEPMPMAALDNYAADLAADARGGDDARHRMIQALVRELDRLQKLKPERAVLSIRLSDSEVEYAAVKSELFFFALEDAAGKDNLHRAIAHLLGAYRGKMWRAEDLRAALELESGKDLAALFREWLTGTGIPGEFRSRY